MQWDASPNAGFSTRDPWLRIAEEYEEINVEKQKKDENSLLLFYKRLLELRKKEKALSQGLYTPVHAQGTILSYIRETDSDRLLIALNLGNKPTQFTPEAIEVKGKIVFSTHPDDEGKGINHTIALKKNQGILIRLTG